MELAGIKIVFKLREERVPAGHGQLQTSFGSVRNICARYAREHFLPLV